jgi:hypothetical protein
MERKKNPREWNQDIRARWNDIPDDLRIRILDLLPAPYMLAEIRKRLGLGYGPSGLTASERQVDLSTEDV